MFEFSKYENTDDRPYRYVLLSSIISLKNSYYAFVSELIYLYFIAIVECDNDASIISDMYSFEYALSINTIDTLINNFNNSMIMHILWIL